MAQRAVAHRKTLACLLSVALALIPVRAGATDGGVPASDAPLALRTTCGLCLNPPAEKVLDDELKRLQGVERTHNAENWLGVVGTSLLVGLTVGLAAGVAVGLLSAR